MVDNHKIMTKDGSTLLHVVCTCTSHDKQRLIDYLLTECRCDPNCLDSKGRMPIQLTSVSHLRIMKTLIEHGAQMTTDIVIKLISKHTNSSVSEFFKLATRKGTILQNPNDLNSDGYTALHLACRAHSLTIVNYLLSVAHYDPNVKSKKFNDKQRLIDYLTECWCDPNCLDSKGRMPIQLTSDLRIMKKLIEYDAQK